MHTNFCINPYRTVYVAQAPLSILINEEIKMKTSSRQPHTSELTAKLCLNKVPSSPLPAEVHLF